MARSCKDETLVPMAVMQARIRAVSLRHGLEEPPAEVGALLSHALQERLKSLLEKLAVISQHRIDTHVKVNIICEDVSMFVTLSPKILRTDLNETFQ